MRTSIQALPEALPDSPKWDQKTPTTRSISVRGIKNLGQTCYLAASVRLIMSCRPLHDTIIDEKFQELSTITTKLMAAVREIPNPNETAPFEPRQLEKALHSFKPEWNPRKQRDATEDWSALIDAPHVCTNSSKRKVDTFQHSVDEDICISADKAWKSVSMQQTNFVEQRPFLRQEVVHRIRSGCHHPKPMTFDVSTSLNVYLPSSDYKVDAVDRQSVDLQILLRDLYSAKSVEVHCDTCRKNTSFAETRRITHLPEYLVFTINRFEQSGKGSKHLSNVNFDINGLDMQEFTIGAGRIDTSSEYNCRAVIHHRGTTMRSGH